MVSTGQESLLRMFGYVTELVSHSLQSNLVDYQKEWINLFIELFSIKPINTLEGPLIQLFIKYTLKLNEKTFKPLFIKMFDWSQDEDRGDVLLFFKLVLGLVNNLKSIFVPYFGIFIDNALEIVVKGRNDLWKIVIECFLKCFTFDTTGFINEERFEKVLPPLIGLLDSDSDAEEYKEDMEQVIATMGVLAKACHVESAWKKLNKQALLQTRSDNANVRWAGLKVVHELYRVLGEEMLVFFPETIPFLAEVMDDDDPEVEMACQDLCMQIQTFLGEPIQQYFSTS
jgi:hypothetical protein